MARLTKRPEFVRFSAYIPSVAYLRAKAESERIQVFEGGQPSVGKVLTRLIMQHLPKYAGENDPAPKRRSKNMAAD